MTGLRLAEIVRLSVDDAFFPDGSPRTRVHIRREIAKGWRAGDVFLPDKLAGKLRKFWAHKLGAARGRTWQQRPALTGSTTPATRR